MVDKVEEVVVSSEQEAFEALKAALNSEFQDKQINLKFKGWPILEIELDGPGYKSTITSDMAEALVAIQAAMNRTYALVVKNQATARHLTDEEKRSIQFKAKIEDGCSLIKIDIGKFADELVKATVGRMTGTQVTVAIVGATIAIASTVAYKDFLQNQTANKAIEQEAVKAMALSKEETARMKIFAEALNADKRISDVKGDFDGARTEILRGVSDAKSLTISGVELPRIAAQAAVTKKRESSREAQLNGTYTVDEASFKNENATKIYVRAVTDGRSFAATFQDDSLDKDQMQLLKDAAFEKKQVFLSINGTELRGEVTTAHIISVRAQPVKK